MNFAPSASASAPADGDALLPISVVEASTGIAKETLRAWERRYGFPMPVRDAAGERLYSAQQLGQLRDAKRLIDRGARPGQIFVNGAIDDSGAHSLRSVASRGLDRFAEWIALLAAFRMDELAAAMQRELLRRGLPAFTSDVLAPCVRAVGEAWQTGQISVAAEHLFTARVSALLQSALVSVPGAPSRPTILCATVAGERHGLGLLMAQAMLAEQGLRGLDLGVDLPLAEIAMAARAGGADIVMLSFSAHFNHRQVPSLLGELLAQLPDPVDLWVGGADARSVRAGSRIRVTHRLDDLPGWVADWQFVQARRAVQT